MQIWPFSIFKARQTRQAQQNGSAPPAAIVQARQSYISPYANTTAYLAQPQDADVFRIMRQAIPILDTAVDKLVMLTGSCQIVWDSERVQEEWDTWVESVRLAPLSRGFNSWLNGMQGRALMFGTGASEIVPDAAGRDIYGLQFISPNSLRMRPDPENPLDVIVAQQQSSMAEPVVLTREFVALAANEPEDESPYGQSIFAHCPFIAELWIEMVHALKQDWNRVGAPSQAITVDIPDNLDPGTDLNVLMGGLVNTIRAAWTEAMNSRRERGVVKDFFGAGKIAVQTIGADGKRLEFEIPARAAMEQIVAVTHLPPFMLGFHWSTTERLSQEQAESLEDVLRDYQAEYTPHALWAADWWARVRGYASVGREAQWPETNLRDRVEQARGNLINAQAQATREKTATRLWQCGVYNQQRYADEVTGEENTPIETEMDEPPAQVSSAGFGQSIFGRLDSARNTEIRALVPGCGCGPHEKADDARVSYGEGEVPADERISTAIDGMYGDLVDAVRALREDWWRILRLPEATAQRRAASGVTKDEESDLFTFTVEQERALDRAIERFLETMAGNDRTRLGFTTTATADGVLQQWEIFAHSLGVRRAMEMSEVDAAALTPDRSSAAVRNLLDSAFDRLSTAGRLRLEDDLPAIKNILREGVELGENPLSVARTLTSEFDSYEGWRFQRLARTEIAFAQTQGQMDEFRAEGDIDTSEIEGRTPPYHPNCVCSVSLARQEDGSWKVVPEIAATACSLCQAYASQNNS